MEIGVPRPICMLNTLVNCYYKLNGSFKWENIQPAKFALRSEI